MQSRPLPQYLPNINLTRLTGCLVRKCIRVSGDESLKPVTTAEPLRKSAALLCLAITALAGVLQNYAASIMDQEDLGKR